MTVEQQRATGGFWRTLGAALPIGAPVVLVNAAIQALLILGSPATLVTLDFVARLVASTIALIVAGWLLMLAVDAAARGQRFGVRNAAALGLVAIIVVLATAAWILSPYLMPVFLVLGLALAPAVAAGEGAPFRAAARAIRRRPGRAVLAIVVSIVLAPISWVVSLITGFFVTGPLGSFLAFVWLGLVALVLLTLWTRVGAARS